MAGKLYSPSIILEFEQVKKKDYEKDYCIDSHPIGSAHFILHSWTKLGFYRG